MVREGRGISPQIPVRRVLTGVDRHQMLCALHQPAIDLSSAKVKEREREKESRAASLGGVVCPSCAPALFGLCLLPASSGRTSVLFGRKVRNAGRPCPQLGSSNPSTHHVPIRARNKSEAAARKRQKGAAETQQESQRAREQEAAA